MSTTIDQKVVEMRFDNSRFENNARTSISTLDKLKQSLNLTGASKGIENVNAAARNCNFAGMGSAIETVRSKFSALEVMGITALANITNSAVNAGKKITSALTIEPIKTGFQEYETQINAVQTILANTKSKGSTLDDVNSALDELNTYADKTIYNFTEMTKNIGTFTAAGVDLDKSVTSIKGIANLAAISGSTSQQASTAMYQLSQALAAGKVSLMDWNSVVNAGMGGQIFQDALKRTAENMGTNVDALIKKYGSFRESLTQGEWLTADVLTETLTQLSGAYSEADLLAKGYTKSQAKEILELADTAVGAATEVKTFTQLWDTLKESAQSGWTQSWEIIVGDFEEAKKLLTKVSKTIGSMLDASSKARNDLLQGWKDKGGRTAIIDSLGNIFEGILSVIKPIKEAFRDIFPPITVKQLVSFSKSFKELTEKFKIGDTTADNLKRTFKGVFAILDIGMRIVKPLIGIIAKVFVGVIPGLLDFTARIGDAIVKFDEFLKTSNVCNKAVEKIGEVFTTVVGTIKNFVNNIKQAFSTLGNIGGNVVDSFANRVETRFEPLKALGNVVSKVFSGVSSIANKVFNGIISVINKVSPTISKFASKAKESFGNLFSGVTEAIGNADFDKVLDLINTGLTGGLIASIITFANKLSNIGIKITTGADAALGDIKGILDGVKGSLEAYQSSLKANTLLKIAGAIGILAAAILVISLIDSDKLAGSLGAVTVLFADLMGSMALFGKIDGKFTGVIKQINVMIAISIAVLILASALKKISDLSFEDLVKGLIGIVVLTELVVISAKLMASSEKKVIKGATQMVIFAVAVKMLASVCKSLASLSWEELAKGLVGVGALMAEISLFLKTAKFDGKAITTATGIVILSAAIAILASVCKSLTSLSWEELGKGLAGVGALMAEISLFLKTAKFDGKAITTATGIVILSAAIKILATAVKDFSGMSWEEIGKGLATIGGLLAELAVFTNLTGNAKHIISTGIALVLIGASIKIFASAIKDFAGMSWEEIGRGLSAMAAALLEVIIAVNLMPKNMLSASVGLLVISSALVVLADALGKMGGMSWDEIGRGLASLGGSMLILAIGLHAMNGTISGSAALLVASMALSVLAPVLTTLGGMSWESIAKGLVAIAGALAIIGIAGYLLGPMVPTILALSGAIALFGLACLSIGAGISLVATGLAALAAVSMSQATAIVETMTVIVAGIAELIPIVIAAIGEGILLLCEGIAKGAPIIGQAIIALITMLMDVIVKCAPSIGQALNALILMLVDVLVTSVPVIADGALKLIIALLETIAEHIPDIVKAGVDVVVALIDGLIKKLPDLIQAAFDLIIGFINGLADAINTNTPLLVEAINNLIIALLNAALTVLSGGISLLKRAGSTIMNSGLIKGIASKVSSLLQTIKSAIGKCVKGIIGKLGEFKDAGVKLINKLITGIKSKATNLKNSCTNLIKSAKTAVSNKVSEWTSVGKNLIGGLITGIKDKAKGVVDSAKGVVDDAITAAKNLLKINSPSKVFTKFGMYIDEGLIVGLNKYAGAVVNATKDVSQGAIDTMSNTISNLAKLTSDALNSDMDTKPTIRPVLDLSDVESGAGAINGLFSQRLAVGATANVGAISSMMNQNSQNGTNDDVVSAINKLRKDLGKINSTTYSINGVTYDDGSNISNAVKTLVRAAKVERRI